MPIEALDIIEGLGTAWTSFIGRNGYTNSGFHTMEPSQQWQETNSWYRQQPGWSSRALSRVRKMNLRRILYDSIDWRVSKWQTYVELENSLVAARAGVAVNTRDKVVTPLWSANTLSASRSWVPDLQHLMLNDLTWSYIIIKLKYTINKMHENHPETIPRHLWKNCLLWSWSLMLKR